MSLWHSFGRQLAGPSGWAGRLTGRFMRVINREPNRLAIEALELVGDEHVLELGFGPGEAIAAVADRLPNGFVEGIDRSVAMLAQATARNRTAMVAGRVWLQLGDFCRLPQRSGSFDAVLAINVAYFWADAPAVVREIRRVLKPDGQLVMYVTDARSMRRWKFAGPETHRLLDVSRVRSALIAGGFRREEIVIARHRLSAKITGLVVHARAAQPLADDDARSAAEMSRQVDHE